MSGVWEQRDEGPPARRHRRGPGRRGVVQARCPTNSRSRRPSADDIGDWLEVIDGWLDAFIGPLDALERCTLEALLKAEAKVAAFARDPATVTPAPPPAAAPAKYATLVPGAERERQWRLGWWDRFQTADGVLPSLARFAVAGALVTGHDRPRHVGGRIDLVVYNGLGRAVVVHVGDQTATSCPRSRRRTFDGLTDSQVHVVTETTTGEPIETFDASVDRGFQRYVYNVAGAAALVRWSAVYGTAVAAPDRELGAPRWTATDASVLFERPPERVSTKGRGTTKSVLTRLRRRSVRPCPRRRCAIRRRARRSSACTRPGTSRRARTRATGCTGEGAAGLRADREGAPGAQSARHRSRCAPSRISRTPPRRPRPAPATHASRRRRPMTAISRTSRFAASRAAPRATRPPWRREKRAPQQRLARARGRLRPRPPLRVEAGARRAGRRPERATPWRTGRS